jgi:hypothetical protein
LRIPSNIWPDRPPTKIKEATDALYGNGAFTNSTWRSSKILGLAGEAMVNFGPLAVPVSFAVLGAVVAAVRRITLSWQIDDSRILLVPFLVNLCFMVLTVDSDILYVFFIKNGLLPLGLIWISSRSLKTLNGLSKWS